MKKQTKKKGKKYHQPVGEVHISDDIYRWTGGTNDAIDSATAVVRHSPIYKAQQSINQKTERSEQDVKKHLNDLILPHFILTLFNTVLLILALIA